MNRESIYHVHESAHGLLFLVEAEVQLSKCLKQLFITLVVLEEELILIANHFVAFLRFHSDGNDHELGKVPLWGVRGLSQAFLGILFPPIQEFSEFNSAYMSANRQMIEFFSLKLESLLAHFFKKSSPRGKLSKTA